MHRMSYRRLAVTVSFVAAATAVHCAPRAVAHTGPGWISLFDGNTIGPEWDRYGETNWRVEDGAIVADKRTSQTEAHLVTKTRFRDFQLYVEFWASDEANSGIFLRCSDLTVISSRTCYEANIYDQRPDPTYGTGAIVDFVEVHPLPKAGGKWNTYEITVKGRQVTAVLNGQKTAELHNGLFTEGPLTLQHGAGVIKFRKVAVRPITDES
jgi:hypothetical protein